MKSYISIREAAEKWGVSERRINQYCAEGRIPGAQRFGKSWAIPDDAEKPGDPRRTRWQTKSAPEEMAPGGPLDHTNLMPLMNTAFAPGHCREAAEGMAAGPQRDIALAEYHYFSGQPEAAVCETCGQPYGEKDPDHHTGAGAWLTTATTHTKVYSCCQAVIEVETNHTWENGTCTVCQYGCQHKGGTATCSQLAQCEICGSLYGDYDLDNHKASETWTQENDKHYHICEYGCGTHLDEADCSGGEATCTEKAVCHICRQAYGSVDPDNHSGKVVWEQTATTHSSVYDCCGAEAVAEEAHEWENGVCSECGYECRHSGGEATCTEKAVCHICGDEYGDVNASNHTNLVKTEAKPATHLTEGNTEYWYCDGCDKYFSDEAGTNEIALEDTVIPKLTEHTADGTGWHRDEESHWHTCECGEVIDKAAHSYKWVIDKEATATETGLKHEECSVCGYAKAAVEIPATGTATDPSDENEKPSIGAPTDPNTSTGNNQTGTSTGNNQTDNKTSPQTGDERDLALWIFSLAISGCAIMGSVIYHKRKKC